MWESGRQRSPKCLLSLSGPSGSLSASTGSTEGGARCREGSVAGVDRNQGDPVGPWAQWKGYPELWFLVRLAQTPLILFLGKTSGRSGGWGQHGF